MIEVKILPTDDVRHPFDIILKLKEAGIPVISRPRFDPRGDYSPVLEVERGRLEWFDDTLNCVRVFRWRE